MSIELVRIDDRLIHGQVVMAWSKAVSIKRIVVIDDKVAKDLIRKMLLETVAPPGVKVSVLNTLDGIEYLKSNANDNEKLLLLFTNPATIVTLVENGVAITKVNIGGMSFMQGKTQLTKAVSLDEDDKNAFKALHKCGIILQIQVLPNDSPVDIMTKI
ncbi:PTS sugar transporter subunit IIB [Pelosinus sp. UFO1]|uniref:PTS system mannose/fructose/N-acetylgalactosamine-transporter subunit IIB n=1 Tax=Pelosinus sp. UFO1 TaxID=484770 RepID=UPI0004D1C93E|nr:PTS sugar transporter subunit IIB [Pelosinus sp. UFO1]AIF50632.1 Protein-N(pi)-phosphohistidine--sugar phosphotransferase [Pelosinus sp. UFO1]